MPLQDSLLDLAALQLPRLTSLADNGSSLSTTRDLFYRVDRQSWDHFAEQLFAVTKRCTADAKQMDSDLDRANQLVATYRKKLVTQTSSSGGGGTKEGVAHTTALTPLPQSSNAEQYFMKYLTGGGSAGAGGSSGTTTGGSNTTQLRTSHQGSSGCSCHGPAQCVHKQVLANHIVDLTFDSYKHMLQERLRAQDEELALLRSGAMLQQKDTEIAALRAALREERERYEQLKAETSQNKLQGIDQWIASKVASLQPVPTRPPSTTRMGLTTARSDPANVTGLAHQLAESGLFSVLTVSVLRHLCETQRHTELQWESAQLHCFLSHLGASSVSSGCSDVGGPRDVYEADRGQGAVGFRRQFRPPAQLPPQRLLHTPLLVPNHMEEAGHGPSGRMTEVLHAAAGARDDDTVRQASAGGKRGPVAPEARRPRYRTD